jgi:hypothetical protein
MPAALDSEGAPEYELLVRLLQFRHVGSFLCD